MARTIVDKIWQMHEVASLGDGWSLLHVDRHLIHDLSGSQALKDLTRQGLTVAHPRLSFATPDHMISSRAGRTGATFPPGEKLWQDLRTLASTSGMRLFDYGQIGHGIVHVMGPELGIILPGTTVVCCDSHTCTNGALGALAFGIGSSEGTHALTTQTVRMRKPQTMRIRVDGSLGKGVVAKDLGLHILRTLGAGSGVGFIVEYAGQAILELDIEGRLTLCNLSVELGARTGIIAPDEKTITYVSGREFAPEGDVFDAAAKQWLNLASDPSAEFARECVIDAGDVTPMVTWGTSPDQAVPVTGRVPAAPADGDPANYRSTLDYMGLSADTPLEGLQVDWVFIGSCTNSRISDLRDAARIISGHRVAEGVNAWVVPGSESVKRTAEAEGLDRIFREAGFSWREPGCSMCVAANGEQVPPGARAISTSNRNFVGRQGPNARTHLASPAMAAAAAIKGHITDVRKLQ